MQNNIENTELVKYGCFLTALVKSALKDSDPPTPFEGINWQTLFFLAQRHDLVLLVFPIIKKLGLPSEDLKLFTKEKNFMLARITRQEIESEVVFSRLEAEKIRYIKMKGAHLKDLYPTFTRTHTDVDLCISMEDREKAKPVMKSLGYENEGELEYHDEYKKDEFYIFELHSRILADDEHSRLFTEPFEKSICENSGGFCYKLKNEYLYLNVFFHLYRHFYESGCGIRNFVDLYLLRESLAESELEFAQDIIEKSGMGDFHRTCLELSACFFEGREIDHKLFEIAEFVFSSTATGFYSFHKANLGFFGKAGYFLKMWFPSAKDLAFRYPVLEKAPVLLPVCWVRRICYSIFFKPSAFKTQAKNIKEINNENYKKIRKARRNAVKKRKV